MNNPFERMAAVNTVRVAYWNLPERVHGDDPRTVFSRLLGACGNVSKRGTSHEDSVRLAALAVALVAAVERAEEASVTAGDAA